MHRGITGAFLLAAALPAWCQTEAPAKFEAADIHPSAKSTMAFPRTSPVRNGRYEVKTATIVDLIRMAYGFDNDKILGGPSWLELDRFDVTGKVPPETTADSQKLMLQALLEDRFHLKIRKDTKPLPSYVLTAGKKPSLKEATGSEEVTGCKVQTASGAPQEGGIRLFTSTNGGPTTTINLGPGATLTYNCRNMTMASFAAGLRGMMGANLGSNPVLDETGIKGNWNFDLKYSMQMIMPMGGDSADRIPLAAAIEKQLGLKLEERQIPTPVLVVESVDRAPTPNPPGTAEALPRLPAPTAFEVASIKATPNTGGPMAMMSRMQMQPGGRLVIEGMNLRFIINRAFNTNNNDAIVGVPAFANTDRYEILAKVPGDTAVPGQMDMDAMAPLLLNLLQERFGLKYHTEEREVSTYALVAAKPKMKKADPESRTYCKTPNPPAGAPPGSRFFTCQNATMAYFAEKLQGMAPDLSWPVADATGLEGGWDLNLTFSMRFPAMMVGAPRPVEGAGGAAMPTASDPVGGLTIFEAIEKQLGLKLEKQKRSMPVIVIDHLEPKPTEN
jgi:uncharacterized protein (TIGR03435 family)